MTRLRAALVLLVPFVLLAACAEARPELERGEAPNVLLIIADDLGWGDLGCYGAPVLRTPRLDALAQQGVRLTHFYVASPMCSSSRASLLTGRYPARHGVVQALVAGNPMTGLDPDEVLLPELLAARGYVTGLVGKWHLGREPRHHPLQRGFDEFFGMLEGSSGYFEHSYRGAPDLWRGSEPVVSDGSYSTFLFADEAVSFVERHAQRSWFLCLSLNAPHLADDRASLPAPEAYRAMYADAAGDQRRRDYMAVVTAMDDGVGRVLDALERLDLDDDTIVVFLSDNGPLPGVGDTGGLSGGKDTLGEGGIRMPCLVRAPEIEAGSECAAPLIAMDLMVTMLGQAGAEPPADCVLDGRNAWGALTGAAGSPHAALVFDHPSRRQGPDGQLEHDRVVRRGPLRLTMHRDGSVELHDVVADPGQHRDLAGLRPDTVEQLRALWEQHATRVGMVGE